MPLSRKKLMLDVGAFAVLLRMFWHPGEIRRAVLRNCTGQAGFTDFTVLGNNGGREQVVNLGKIFLS